MPQELQLLNYIDRFGVQAIMGRPLGAGELRRMAVAEKIVTYYLEREQAESWASWAVQSAKKSRILNDAMQAAIELGMIDGQ